MTKLLTPDMKKLQLLRSNSMLNQEQKEYFEKVEAQRYKQALREQQQHSDELNQTKFMNELQRRLEEKEQLNLISQKDLENTERLQQINENQVNSLDLDYHIINTCEFKYCQNLSRELKIQTIGLRKGLQRVMEKRQILSKILSRKANDSQSPLISFPESQSKKKKSSFSLKALPTGIDIQASSIENIQEYFSNLYLSKNNTSSATFQANFEALIFKKRGLKIQQNTKLSPILCYIGLKHYLQQNNFKSAPQLLNQILKQRPNFIPQFFSQDIIDLLFEKSIQNQSNQTLESLINICISEGFDISQLKLDRFRIPLEFFLSQLSADTFDPNYAKVFLKYYTWYHKCRAIRESQNYKSTDPMLKFNSIFNVSDLINISQIFRFLVKFQDVLPGLDTNKSLPIKPDKEDVLLDLVDFWTKYGIQLKCEGQNNNILNQHDIVQFLISRCKNNQSDNFLIIHQILKRYSSVDNQTFANTLTTRLRQQVSSKNILFPFKKQNIRKYYNTVLTKKAQLNERGAQFWAFTLRELKLNPELYDLAINWAKVTGSNNKDLPLYYLADMIFSLPLEEGEYYYKAIEQLVEDMNLTQISKQNSPLILLLKTKAYFKDGNNTFAIKNFLDEMKKYNKNFGNQSQDQLVKLSSVYNALVKNPKTGKILTKQEFRTNYGKMLEQIYGSSAILPFTKEVKNILQERNYVELKYLFEYLRVSHQFDLAQKQMVQLMSKDEFKQETNPGSKGEKQANQLKGKLASLSQKSQDLENKLSAINTRKLSQMKKLFASEQFINSIQNLISQYPNEETDTITKMLVEYTEFVNTKKYLSNHVNQIQEMNGNTEHHPLGLDKFKQFTSLKSHLRTDKKKKRSYDDENDEFQQLFSPQSSSQQLIKSLQSILSKYQISQKNPDHLPIFTALAIFHGQIQQDTGPLNLWTKSVTDYSKWLKLRQNLKILHKFIEQNRGSVQSLVEGKFVGYIWKFLTQNEEQSAMNEQEQEDNSNTGIKQNSMLDIEFYDNSVNYDTVQKLLFNIIVSPNLIQSEQVTNTEIQINKLTQYLQTFIHKSTSQKESKRWRDFIDLIKKFRYSKIEITNAIDKDIEQFKLLHDSDKQAKVRYIRAQAQQLLGKISYQSGILSDMNEIKEEYDQLLAGLQKQKKENIELKEDNGNLSDKNVVALMLIQSKRTKARIQQMERKLLTLDKLNKKYRNPKVFQGKTLSERIQDFGMNSIQLFKDTVRLRYLEDFKKHEYIINLPSITIQEVLYAKQEMRDILNYELEFFFKKIRSKVSKKAQKLHFEKKKYEQQQKERNQEKQMRKQQNWKRDQEAKRQQLLGDQQQPDQVNNAEQNQIFDQEIIEDDGIVDQELKLQQQQQKQKELKNKGKQKDFNQGEDPQIFEYKSSKSQLLQHLNRHTKLESELNTKNRRGEENSKLVSIQIPNPKKTHIFNQYDDSEKNRIIPSYYVGSYDYKIDEQRSHNYTYQREMDQQYTSSVFLEQLNKANDPKYDRFDPYQMKQAHFNRTLGDLKPFLVKQIGARQNTLRQQIEKAFEKLKTGYEVDNSSKRFTNSLNTASPDDIDIIDDKIALKNPGLTLDKIAIFLEDQVHSDLLKKLKLYQNELNDVNSLQFAQSLSKQTLGVEVSVLEQLFVQLHYKKQLLQMIENHYQEQIDKRKKEDSSIQNYLSSLEEHKFEANQENSEVINQLYNEFVQIERKNEESLNDKKDLSQKLGVKAQFTESDNKHEKANLMKKMFGINSEYYPLNYALDLISFGLENDVAAAIRLGQAALTEIPNAYMPHQMKVRIKEYLEMKQEKYNEYAQITGPLAIESLYKNEEAKMIKKMKDQEDNVHFIKRGSYWESYFTNLNAFDSWKIPSRHRDEYSKYKGLERVIPKQCLENLDEMKRRIYYI